MQSRLPLQPEASGMSQTLQFLWFSCVQTLLALRSQNQSSLHSDILVSFNQLLGGLHPVPRFCKPMAGSLWGGPVILTSGCSHFWGSLPTRVGRTCDLALIEYGKMEEMWHLILDYRKTVTLLCLPLCTYLSPKVFTVLLFYWITLPCCELPMWKGANVFWQQWWESEHLPAATCVTLGADLPEDKPWDDRSLGPYLDCGPGGDPGSETPS